MVPVNPRSNLASPAELTDRLVLLAPSPPRSVDASPFFTKQVDMPKPQGALRATPRSSSNLLTSCPAVGTPVQSNLASSDSEAPGTAMRGTRTLDGDEGGRDGSSNRAKEDLRIVQPKLLPGSRAAGSNSKLASVKTSLCSKLISLTCYRPDADREASGYGYQESG